MKKLILTLFILTLSTPAMTQSEGSETHCNDARDPGKEILECPAGYTEIEGGKCQKGSEIIEKVVKEAK